MLDTKKLALELSEKIEFTPADDRLLVKPMKPVMITKLVPTQPKQEPKSLDEVEQSEPTEPKKSKVEANMQKGIVLKLGVGFDKVNPNNLEVGDIVIYHRLSGIPFELLKDSRILSRYEVQAVVKVKSTVLNNKITELSKNDNLEL